MNKNKFKQFKDECLRLQKKWGLTNYDLFIEEKALDRNALSRIFVDDESFNANIQFDTKKVIECKSMPKELAKHEMIHLILGRMSNLSYNRFIRKDELYASEEEIVTILGKLL